MKRQTKIYLLAIFMSSFFAQAIYAADTHTLGYSSVDDGEIRYGGSTKYDLSYAITQWNALGTINIVPDNASTWEDLTISDVNKSSETWSGLYTHYPVLLTDTIHYNTAIMDNRTTNKTAMNQKTVMHELGHALGIDDHYESQYSNIVMYGYSNSQNTLTTHDKDDYNLVN